MKSKERGAVTLTNRLYKRYPKIVEDLRLRPERYNECGDRLAELEQRGDVFVIRPNTTYGVGRTETDAVKLRQLYDQGVGIARAQMGPLRKYLEE